MTAIGVGIGVGYSARKANGIPLVIGEFLTPDTWERNSLRFSLATGLELGLNEPDDYCKGGRHISGIARGATSLLTRPVKPDVTVPWDIQAAPITMFPDTDTLFGVTVNSFQRADTFAFANIGPVQKHSLVGATTGQTFTASGWVLNKTGTEQEIVIQLRENGGIEPDANAGQIFIPLTPGVWTEYVITGSVVENDRTQLWVNVLDNASTALMDIAYAFCTFTEGVIKSPQFVQGSTAGEFIDGDVATVTAPAWPALPVASTNILSTLFMTEWSGVGDADSRTREDLGNGTFRIGFDGSAAVTGWRFILPDLFLDRTARIQARLVSGSVQTGAADVVAFRSAFANVGTFFQLGDLTSDWQDVDCSVTSGETSDEMAIRTDNLTEFVIEIRALRAVDDVAIPTLAFLPGTQAGETQTAAVIAMAFDNFTTGEIDGIAYGAQVAGDFIYDGAIYGNGEYISFLSAGIPTPEQIVTALSILQTLLTQPVGPCDVDFLTDGEGPPNLLVDDEGTPNVLTAP